MPSADSTDILRIARDFLALQTPIQRAFLDANRAARDWTYLTDLPRSGTVPAAGRVWHFRRHGLGCRFESGGIVVDMHRHVSTPGCIDAHRLVEYVCSLQDISDASGLHADIERLLTEAEADGLIVGMAGEARVWLAICETPPGECLSSGSTIKLCSPNS